MKRITAVFPTRAEAEAAYAALRGLNLAQGAISLLADSSRQVNARTDDSTSSRAGNSGSDPLLEIPLLAPVGGVGGFGLGGGGGVAAGPALISLGGDPVVRTEPSARASDPLDKIAGDLQPLDTPADSSSSGPILSATLEGFRRAGFAPAEAEYYSSAVSQGHAVLSVELGADEQEAGVRQIVSQNEGHPFMGTPR